MSMSDRARHNITIATSVAVGALAFAWSIGRYISFLGSPVKPRFPRAR